MGARLVYFQTALPPISSYAITKIAAEQFIELSAVDHVVFRLANIYGPRNLSGPIPTFYKRLTAGDPCSVVATTRDMVFVADLVDAVMRAVDNPDISGRYDLCSGKHRPIRELYDMVCGVMGSEDTATEVEAGADDVAKMELDPEPARADLGWEASTSPA
jgi:UDP-glucose 4-epimerase